jgi:hypothetical protein
MEFASHSKKWEVQDYSDSPEKLIKSVLSACARHLPKDTLGHMKGFLEFARGSVFASSSIIPPEITLRSEGRYSGGKMVLSVTLIFMGLDAEFLNDAVSRAAMEVCERLGCTFKEIREVI